MKWNEIIQMCLPISFVPGSLAAGCRTLVRSGHSVSELLAGAHVFFRNFWRGQSIFFGMSFSGLPPKTPHFWKYIELMAQCRSILWKKKLENKTGCIHTDAASTFKNQILLLLATNYWNFILAKVNYFELTLIKWYTSSEKYTTEWHYVVYRAWGNFHINEN